MKPDERDEETKVEDLKRRKMKITELKKKRQSLKAKVQAYYAQIPPNMTTKEYQTLQFKKAHDAKLIRDRKRKVFLALKQQFLHLYKDDLLTLKLKQNRCVKMCNKLLKMVKLDQVLRVLAENYNQRRVHVHRQQRIVWFCVIVKYHFRQRNRKKGDLRTR